MMNESPFFLILRFSWVYLVTFFILFDLTLLATIPDGGQANFDSFTFSCGFIIITMPVFVIYAFVMKLVLVNPRTIVNALFLLILGEVVSFMLLGDAALLGLNEVGNIGLNPDTITKDSFYKQRDFAISMSNFLSALGYFVVTVSFPHQHLPKDF